MKKYQLWGFTGDKNLGVLCKTLKTPRTYFVFWSKFEESRNKRIVFNIITGTYQKFLISIFAKDIYTHLEEIPKDKLNEYTL